MKTTTAIPSKSEAAPEAKPRGRMATALQRLQRAMGNLRIQQLIQAHCHDPFEAEADRVAGQVKGQGRTSGAVRRSVEAAMGMDLSEARVHDDPAAHRIAEGLHANAVTRGNDIYLHERASQSEEGNRVLAHELTHVAQQRGPAAGRVQCDLIETQPQLALGRFAIAMEALPEMEEPPGMKGTITFHPDPHGPYSAEIALIQIANVTDVAGETTVPGEPLDYAKVGTGAESARNELMTTGIDGAPRGWFVDTLTANRDRTSGAGPNYVDQYVGYLRSPTDFKEAMLGDWPRTWREVDYDFETVAKGTDTQVIYGVLRWGFGIRSGAVVNEYVRSVDTQSPAFDEALERFRGYYTHEPVVLYFDTNIDTPMSGESAKLTDAVEYLNRYPDTMVHLEGFADERGDVAENVDLSLRRADTVQSMLTSLGIDPLRIEVVSGAGKTSAFAAGRTPGRLQANRRAVITFVRTANTPIVMP
jgi:outer membrane protein OmpA-like peptidoglycan-associated protein